MSLLWVGGRRVFGTKAQPWGSAWLSEHSLARRERRAGLGEELSTAAAGSRLALLLETALEPAHQAHTWLLRNAGQRVMSLCNENRADSFHRLHPASPCACREVRERIAGTFCALQPTRSKAGWGRDGCPCCLLRRGCPASCSSPWQAATAAELCVRFHPGPGPRRASKPPGVPRKSLETSAWPPRPCSPQRSGQRQWGWGDGNDHLGERTRA